VHAKISGLMMPVLGHTFYKENRTATVDEIIQLLTPLIQHAIRVFGTDRIMFASNYPMDKPNARLTDLIQAYIKMIEPYGSEALQAIFRQNAIHFYQLDIN
jgi:predicted TIM-barrel fold metal-dependent hydrolase